jgi:hypothetical protein
MKTTPVLEIINELATQVAVKQVCDGRAAAEESAQALLEQRQISRGFEPPPCGL